MKRICLGAVLTLGGLVLAGCPTQTPPVTTLNPSPRLFKTLYRFATGASTSAITAADLNGDHLKDLVTSNRGAASISVVLADANGGYKDKVDYAVGDSPATISLVDVNKDGFLDAVCANAGTDDISVLLGKGDGTFQAQVKYPLLSGSVPSDLVAADLNADGNLDLAVACTSNNTVSILYGHADGTFGLVPTVIPVGKAPRSIVAADLDKNGVLDLVTANRDSNSLSILSGQADYTFSAPISVAAGTNPRTVRVGNLDGDGWPDLVVSNPGSGDLSVIKSSGGGNFEAQERIAVTHLPTRFILQDLDGDGALDLAVILYSEKDSSALGEVEVLKGDGLGGFSSPRFFAVGEGALDVQAIKMDSDNNMDLLATGGAIASVIFGSGGLSFETEERYAAGTLPRGIAVADFDRDGHMDLAVSNLQSNDIWLYLGDGHGLFGPAGFVEPAAVDEQHGAVAFAVEVAGDHPAILRGELDGFLGAGQRGGGEECEKEFHFTFSSALAKSAGVSRCFTLPLAAFTTCATRLSGMPGKRVKPRKWVLGSPCASSRIFGVILPCQLHIGPRKTTASAISPGSVMRSP